MPWRSRHETPIPMPYGRCWRKSKITWNGFNWFREHVPAPKDSSDFGRYDGMTSASAQGIETGMATTATLRFALVGFGSEESRPLVAAIAEMGYLSCLFSAQSRP